MEKDIQNTGAVSNAGNRGRRPVWLRVLKWTACAAGGIMVLLATLLAVAGWYLTPERLTPLVEKYGSEYLHADVSADRVELTIWSSFPQVRLDVSNLRLTSRTLQGQPGSVMKQLPADASRLLEAGTIKASINPWGLLKGTILLGDIKASGVGINLVSYNAEINNYNIVPPSEPKQDEDSKPWKIRVKTISIDASQGIRYYDAQSTTDARLDNLSLTIKSETKDSDRLHTALNTAVSLDMEGREILSSLPVALNGNVGWTQSPMAFSLKDYTINIAGIVGYLTAGLDLSTQPSLTACALNTNPVKIMNVLSLLPEENRKQMEMLRYLDTDMTVVLSVKATTPYALTSGQAPDANVDFTIPACHLEYNDPKVGTPLKLDRLAVKGAFAFNGGNPSLSSLDIPVFDMEGEGVNLSLTASVEEALSEDPRIVLTSKGEAELKRFAGLIPMPGAVLGGSVSADASARCRLSDLLEMKYENIDADGSVEIRNFLFSLPVLATELYARAAKFSFGNNMSSHDTGRLVTGLLRAEADIDTLYCSVPGIKTGMSGVSLQAGATEALLQSKHKGEIMPMGMRLQARVIKADSPTDTMYVSARGFDANGIVTRFEGKARSPLLKASVKADRLRYTDPYMRMRANAVSADVSAHLNERKKTGKSRYQRRYDAIAKANPGLSADSIAKLASMPRKKADEQGVFRLDLDNGIKALFRQWGISGHVNSDRIALTHIAYPVRTILRNLAFDFSLDSLRLHRASLESEENKMTVSGDVTNLRHMMLGRVRTPLKIRFNADVDNLNLNQIAYNFKLGQALQSQRGHLVRINPEEEDALVRAAATIPAEEPTTDTLTLLVPRNIDALVRMNADRLLYENINVYDARTSVAMNDGAFSVESLTARTDFGNAYLNMLYSSREIEKLNLALDLGFSNVNIDDFLISFPQVKEMMPVITNLHGQVGARLAGSMDIFPNMDLDISSLNAVLNISGSDLTLTQDPTIRKVARMMLIRKKGDLNISDMDIQVAVHDNVLRLYPFSFGMEKYRFALLGENDLAQNMYYHLSVLKSPIPFKFGINIKGTFDNPKFRFGGAKYKENEAREMVNLVEDQRINFVKAMRLELHKLIDKAALSYTDRKEYHNYNQESERKTPVNDTETQELDNPVDLISNSLKAPVIKALNSDAIKNVMSKFGKNDKKKDK